MWDIVISLFYREFCKKSLIDMRRHCDLNHLLA